MEEGPGEDQVLGISYGTVIGASFAAMHPHRVDRMLIDGVADTEAFMQGDWTDVNENADDAVDVMYEMCHKAGARYCPLAFAGNSPAMLKAASEAAIEDLRINPYAVEGTESRGPQLVITQDIMNLMIAAAYRLAAFEDLASGLAGIIRRKGPSWVTLYMPQRTSCFLPRIVPATTFPAWTAISRPFFMKNQR